MRRVNYEALREAVQNHQSMLAWCQAIPGSPDAEWNCDAALAVFKRHIHHRGAGIAADLLDELEEAKSQLNEQREYYEDVISDGNKRIAELETREVQLPTRYDLRYGYLINADGRHVIMPKENGSWLYLIDLEHTLRVTGIRIKREEHGNKARG